MRFLSVSGGLVVVVCSAILVAGRPSTDIQLSGPFPMIIRTENHFTALLLSFGQDAKTTAHFPASNCIHLCDSNITTARVEPRNCLEVQKLGHDTSGVYTIRPYDCCPDREVDVYCDMATDGGGWTVIQRRDKYETQENFLRTWKEYVEGFGDLEKEFWLGLDHAHALTNQSEFEARFDLEDFEGSSRFAKYQTFSIDDQDHFYALHINGYSGDAGDSMEHHRNRKFSTRDNDNDDHGTNCAAVYSGAWWYGTCHNVNLNGVYYEGITNLSSQGIIWREWKGTGYSLKKTEIKIRPKVG